jgi:hypothetical protein
MFAAHLAAAADWFQDPRVSGALVSIAFLAILLAKLIYDRRSQPREPEKLRTEFREFPSKHGLAQIENTERGQIHEGKVDGFRVIVKLGPGHAPQDDRKRHKVLAGYACVSVQCSKAQPPGLQLWKETTRDAARKETRQLNEVIVGDHDLDRALIIRGTQAAQIKQLIAQPEVREKLLEFFDEWPLSIVTDYWVKCEDDEGEPGTQLLGSMLSYALGVAKALDEHAVKPK